MEIGQAIFTAAEQPVVLVDKLMDMAEKIDMESEYIENSEDKIDK